MNHSNFAAAALAAMFVIFAPAKALGQCLDANFGQWPGATYTPSCTGSAGPITTCGFGSEYSRVNVTDGEIYEFGSSVGTDFITISNADGDTAFAWGQSPLAWQATFTGEVRFYTHLDASCPVTGGGCRTKTVLCPATLPVDLIFTDRFEDNSFRDCPDCPAMVVIPGGSFTQGSPASEPQSLEQERPQRTVNVPAFAMGQYSVTFDEWDACVADDGCTHNPGDQGWGGGNHPVINVSWDDAQEYVTWLSNKTGHDYRLPSESEWEYATRAGTTGRFNTGDCITTDQANFFGPEPAQGCPTGIFRNQTLPVGSFAANAFGLYDTHGNAIEWVEDCWNEDYAGAPTDGSAWMSGDCSLAVLRGGSWGNTGGWLRSATRYWDTRGDRHFTGGFRVARSITL